MAMERFRITKSEIGASKWPFTMDEVTILRDSKTPAFYVKAGKELYNLNGIAKKGRPLEEIWLENPDIPRSKISISFIFSMCGKKGLL